MKRACIVLIPALLIGGCAASRSGYPSLLPRAVEQQSLAPPKPEPTPVVTPDMSLDDKIAALTKQFDSATDAFDNAMADARPIITAGQNVDQGSPAWLNAQQALATLDAYRAAMLEPFVALEQLAITRAQAGDQPYPKLDQAIAHAEAEDTSRTQELDTLENITDS
ncbi:hypothetical protein GCM10023219_26810 [Stakelama sediminis]|uniref:Acetyl-CoA acetyltransferase n=1 Tax=Stakelama sediminis TaxID=463200 RepID=A0A840YY90_9SPHN|nr:hypothetical protein [Stakelama sediminis]MBB5718638.1 acetyl-CoA acetyltransferase [Stakelama sediminis]